jgi:hypothetical protein
VEPEQRRFIPILGDLDAPPGNVRCIRAAKRRSCGFRVDLKMGYSVVRTRRGGRVAGNCTRNGLSYIGFRSHVKEGADLYDSE